MSYAQKCYNSVLGDQCSATGRIRGRYVFSYCWDRTGGHFPNVKELAAANGLYLHGQSEDKDFADASRKDLISEQKSLFGQGASLIDINLCVGKSVLTTLELFTYFAENKIFSIDSLSAHGGALQYLK